MIDLAELVTDPEMGAVAVQRLRTTGERVAGRWRQTGVEVVSSMGCLQPASGEQLERLPEGRRARTAKTLYTDLELRGPSAGDRGDQVQVGDDVYDVEAVENYEQPGGYRQALLTLRDSSYPPVEPEVEE